MLQKMDRWSLPIPMAEALVCCVPAQQTADNAANNRADVDMFRCTIKDRHHPEIVVGHAVLVLAYGSEVSCNGIIEVIEAIHDAEKE